MLFKDLNIIFYYYFVMKVAIFSFLLMLLEISLEFTFNFYMSMYFSKSLNDQLCKFVNPFTRALPLKI